MMGRLGEVALLLALFVLLGSLHGTRAQYDEYDYEDYDEYGSYDYDEDEDMDEDYQEEDADASGRPEEAGEGGEAPMAYPQNQEFAPMCNNENCWIRVDWEPPPRDTWRSCLLGYRVGFRKFEPYEQQDWTRMNDEGTHIDLMWDRLLFFEEAEGTNHSLTIHSLDFETHYEVIIEVFNPHGSGYPRIHEVDTPSEPCREASVPQPDKFFESSENSLSVHLGGWQDANCPTVYFIVEQRERGKEEWSSVSRSAKPGADIVISNLSPATWYQIKVTGEAQGPSSEPSHTSLQFEIATLATDGSGFSGCVIEKHVKYSGNNLWSKRGINQETCAALCFRRPACTHWTYNPTFQGGKCWMKTSGSGRTKSTTGSISGQKACGGRGFSLPEVTSKAAAAMASCSPPWTSLDTGCYLFQEWNSTWYDSRRECKQSGGFLVEIDSEEEQNAIMNEITARGWDGETHFGFWIGLTAIFHDGTWVWDNLGKPLDFSNWAPGEPNHWHGIQHCAAINLEWANGHWDDVGCEAVMIEHRSYGDTYGHICEAAGSSMTYTKETGMKWENENGKSSHMKVSMVHDEEECEKECTATVPCIAFTFIPGMEICALKAPKDAVTLVPAGGEMISGSLDGERPNIRGKELDSNICLACLPECNVYPNTKFSGHNLYPLGAETQEECAAACLREPECNFWTHNPNVGRCWLKKSDLVRSPSSKGSNSGQKSCGVTEDDILSGRVIEDGCDCTSETTEACSIEENTKYSGHNLYTRKGIKVGNRAGCAALCFEDSKCKFWTYNPRVSKCWMKTSDQGRSPSTTGSFSGPKACGAPANLEGDESEGEEPESLPASGHLTSPNFPANYPLNLHERKTIEVAKGNVINIHFTDLDVERPYDYVDIIDGDGTFLAHFGRQHKVDEGDDGEGSGDGSGEGSGEGGERQERVITSFTEIVHVLFHTDDSVSRSGWRLEWSSSPASQRELPTSGHLASPNYPHDDYPNHYDSVQRIRVPEGNTIWIRFTDFVCEREYDTVTITDKDGTRLGLFDGKHDSDDDWRTKEIVSNSDMVEVLFHSDGSANRKGWRLNWGMVGESGPKSGVLYSPNFTSSIYPNSHDSTQTIEVAEGRTIRFEFTDFNTEPEYDYVWIMDENGEEIMGRTWGTSGAHRLGTSYSNIMHVKFHTDGDTQRTGWRLEWNEQ